MAEGHKNDLPLMANTSHIQVVHFVLDLKCSLQKRTFEGSITLFLKPICDERWRGIYSNHDYQSFLLGESDKNMTKDISSLKANDNKETGINLTAQKTVEVRHCEKNSKTTWTNAEVFEKGMDNDIFNGDVLHVASDKSPCADSSYSNSVIETHAQDPFHLILDSCDIDVTSVDELILPPENYDLIHKHLVSSQFTHIQKCLEKFSKCPLQYTCGELSIDVWKSGVFLAEDFPRIVEITYSTKPQGESLIWTRDQDQNPSVFTAGAWLNNRSLFPAMDFGCLSTWQANIMAPEGATVLMTGDNSGDCKTLPTGEVCWYYENRTPLPSSNVAIAVGFYSYRLVPHVELPQSHFSKKDQVCRHSPVCKLPYCATENLPCRLFAPASVIDGAECCLAAYLPRCVQAVVSLLGPLPFPRLDVFIVPQCFAHLGLASPNLIFLSQSALSEDGSMLIRMAHEISHYWFGLLLGARDWTEEWLSEGFATYVEDSIHATAMQWTEEQYEQRSAVRACIRYRTLAAELSCTDADLQTLRPNHGEEDEGDDSTVKYVKNGRNMEKMFTQVHYLKGYFLLRYLSKQVGVTKFNDFIKLYTKYFHGQMVSSQDFFMLLFETFPELSKDGLTIDGIYRDWLDPPGMPDRLCADVLQQNSVLVTQVQEEVEKWKTLDGKNRRKAKNLTRKKPKIDHTANMAKMFQSLFDLHSGKVELKNGSVAILLEPDQLVLFFEKLLDLVSMEAKTLQQLRVCYCPQKCHADVSHRWCELVVKHKYRPAYEDVHEFLINHQAMGVYLYGELMISGVEKQRQLAESCFLITGEDMEPCIYKTIYTMLYGCAPEPGSQCKFSAFNNATCQHENTKRDTIEK